MNTEEILDLVLPLIICFGSACLLLFERKFLFLGIFLFVCIFAFIWPDKSFALVKICHSLFIIIPLGIIIDSFYRNYFVYLATQLFNSGRFEEALSLCEQGLKKQPKNYNLHLVAAVCCASLSNYQKTMEFCEKAIAIDAHRYWAYFLRACVHESMNQFDEALKQINIAFKQSDLLGIIQKSDLFILRAIIYCKQKEFEKAKADCNRTKGRFNPQPVFLLLSRLRYSLLISEIEAAEKDLKKLDRMRLSKYHYAYKVSDLARLEMKKGDYKKALSTASSAVDLCQVPWIITSLGIAQLKNELLPQALESFSTAISIDPYFAEAHWYRSEVYEAMNEGDKSEADRKIAADYGYSPYL